MTKAEIIKIGTELGLDYSITWTCYNPQMQGSNYVPCHKCDSCRFRKEGFKAAMIYQKPEIINVNN